MKRFLLTSLLIYPLAAHALLPHAPSEAELAALPAFCAERLKGVGHGGAFQAQLGRANWIHIHHYCHAVKLVNRARQYPRDRSKYLQMSLGEYAYVFKNTRPDFWMRPQMYVELSRVHVQLGDVPQALKWLGDAIAFNPRYEAAYVALIDLQRANGAASSALEVATQGLRHLPESSRLQKSYLELGGKKPFPEPVGAVSTKAPMGSEDVKADGVSPAPHSDDGRAAEEGLAADKGCRFCPPEEIQQRWKDSFERPQ